MKCEHGNEITVIIENFEYSHDLQDYNVDGSVNIFDGRYVRVEGCNKCKTVKRRQELL